MNPAAVPSVTAEPAVTDASGNAGVPSSSATATVAAAVLPKL